MYFCKHKSMTLLSLILKRYGKKTEGNKAYKNIDFNIKTTTWEKLSH